jgi:hypothetical protein
MKSKKEICLGADKKGKEVKQAVNDASALIQMYQAGFLDAYNFDRKSLFKNSIVKFKKIRNLCLETFQMRFASKLQGKIKLKKNG